LHPKRWSNLPSRTVTSVQKHGFATAVGWMRVLPTVGFPVVQFTSVQLPLMAVGIVPTPDVELNAKPSFAACAGISQLTLM